MIRHRILTPQVDIHRLLDTIEPLGAPGLSNLILVALHLSKASPTYRHYQYDLAPGYQVWVLRLKHS